MPKNDISGKAIITGASGFVGSHLRDALLDAGVDVIALRRPGSPPAERGRSAEIDYSDTESLARIFESEKPDYVFHVAGVMNGVRYEDFSKGNVLPTRNLVQALGSENPQLRRFVYVSSLTAYGPSRKDAPMREDAEPCPVEFYGKSKLEAEEAIRAAGETIPWTIIRPGGVYGPGDYQYWELFRLAAKGINPFFGNRKRPLSSMVYIDDLIDAIIAAAQSPATLHKGYFISDGQPVTFEELQQLIVQAVGRKVWDIDLPAFSIDIAGFFGEIKGRITGKPSLYHRQKVIMARQEAWTCGCDAACTDFGYRPRVTLEEGIRKTYDGYRADGRLK
jgi:nucleoside-diphosphate-sugar epimerase